MSEFDARRTQTFDGGNTASGADDAGAGLYRLGNPDYPVSTGGAWQDLKAARGQLKVVRRDNEMLKRTNEQLMRKLVSVSRRAVAANRMAHHDVLTGLPNRLLLIKRLQRAIADAFQRQTLLALLFIDLDGFKAINDRFGHKIGDRLLSVVAARIAACVRTGDIACRYGGDEFVAMLANIDDPAIGVSVSQKIREQVGRRYWIEGHVIQITASIGLAIYPADGERYDALLSNADAAMYRSKAARRTLCALSGTTATAGLDSRIR